MTITVQKQVEETLEVETPCYYKTLVGYQHINEKGQIVTVYTSMVAVNEPSKDKHYTDDVQRMIKQGHPCKKEEFEKAYADAIENFDIAVSSKKETAQHAFIAEAAAAEGLGALAE